MYVYVYLVYFFVCKKCGLNPPVLSHTQPPGKKKSGASGPNLQFPVLLPHVERCPGSGIDPITSSTIEPPKMSQARLDHFLMASDM